MKIRFPFLLLPLALIPVPAPGEDPGPSPSQARAQGADLTAFGIPPGAAPVGGALATTRLTGAERVYWDNRPIPITLQVGLERQVTFPAGVRVGLEPALGERVRVQSVDGTVHWLAFQPFETSRVQVREVQSGRTYLLDLRAVAAGGDGHPLEVVDLQRFEQGSFRRVNGMPIETPPSATGAPPAQVAGAATVPFEAGPFAQGPPSYDLVRLTRFAFQQLYAPERLLARLDLPGITRVPVRARAVFLYRGGALETTPYVSWTDGLNTVTAVKLENRTAQTVRVDPRDFRGRWLARGLLYTELLARGDPYGRDRGFAVLISPVPFGEALP